MVSVHIIVGSPGVMTFGTPERFMLAGKLVVWLTTFRPAAEM